MNRVKIAPFELFKGEHDDYYKGQRIIHLYDDQITFYLFDYYNCYPENPNHEDAEIIDLWKSLSSLRLSNDFIKTYKGSFGIPLKYAIIKSEKRKYLLLIGDEEVQPTIYRSCIEEIWIVESLKEKN